MSILDALAKGIDHYPGGRASLAPRIGKTDEVLRKELSGGQTHKLGAVDAVRAASMLVDLLKPHCYDYAIAVASECGGRFEPGQAGADKMQSPVQRVSSLMRETSDVATTVIDAMSDGVISDNELAQIEREIEEAECVLQKLRATARHVNQQGKPAHVGN